MGDLYKPNDDDNKPEPPQAIKYTIEAVIIVLCFAVIVVVLSLTVRVLRWALGWG